SHAIELGDPLDALGAWEVRGTVERRLPGGRQRAGVARGNHEARRPDDPGGIPDVGYDTGYAAGHRLRDCIGETLRAGSGRCHIEGTIERGHVVEMTAPGEAIAQAGAIQ